MTHPQLEVLRKADEAFAAGDLEGFFALFHDDFVWHIPGRHSFAGDYTGRDAVPPCSAHSRSDTPRPDPRPRNVRHDEHGIVLERYSTARGDRTFKEQLVNVMRFRDGKISEMWVIPFDQAARDEWMA